MPGVRATILLLCLAAAAADAGQVYKWVDKDGQVHITQTPPPGVAADQLKVGASQRDNPERDKYCAAVKNVAQKIAYWARSGASLETAVGEAQVVEADLARLGATTANVRQIVYFVFNMQGGLRRSQISPEGVSKLAYDNCLSGSFAVVRADVEGAPRTGKAAPQTARSGTGWFVARDLVVTSLHVVKGTRSIRLHFHDGSSADARVAMSDSSHDVAVLSTAARLLNPLEMRLGSVPLGATVFTIGFPHSDVLGVKPKLSNGVISSTNGLQDDVSSYQISVPVQAGNSGGPLLDMNGRVVGVVAAKLRADRMLQETGDLTENVNYAVKSSYVADLTGVTASAGSEEVKSLELLAQELQPSIVRIVAEF